MTSHLKTRARVSFVVDLDMLNARRRLHNQRPLTEAEFFELFSTEATICAATDKVALTFEAKLTYIVA